mmetsp:Transcript_27066/g.33194  ORF Transcript_27066/g.33194 Transcript_27066/m.33194 type:complete len:443 (-) Transcript_27066:160-1488(-)
MTSSFLSIVCYLWIIISGVIAYSGTAGAATIDDISQEEAAEDLLTSNLIAWMKTNGAFISDKIEIQRFQPPGVDYKIRGVFAKEDLAKDEMILEVPWSLIVQPSPEDDEYDDCSTMVNIFLDMKDDEGTPYGKYLKAQPRNYIRKFWSIEGQQLLRDMMGPLGPDYTPSDTSNFWRKRCGKRYNDKIFGASAKTTTDDLLLHAAMITLARADDYLMVPFYDMFNHRNGDRWYNAAHVMEEGSSQGLAAKRTVKRGEQLFLSYNQCNICGGRIHWHGTADMLDDYGFVEPFPQRYYDEDLRLKFDIDQIDEENGTKLTVKWGAPPSEAGAVFLREQLQRLEQMEGMKHEANADSLKVPMNESNKVWELHSAFIMALRAALDSLKGWTLTDIVDSIPNWDEYQYTFDEDGNLVSILDQDGSIMSSVTYLDEYTYESESEEHDEF